MWNERALLGKPDPSELTAAPERILTGRFCYVVQQGVRRDENEINLWVSTSGYKVFLHRSVTQGHLLMDTFNPVDQKQIFWRLPIYYPYFYRRVVPQAEGTNQIL